jgi:hypothetical protein
MEQADTKSVINTYGRGVPAPLFHIRRNKMALEFNEVKPGDGVFEYAPYSYNIGQKCRCNCRYCYARDIAIKFCDPSNPVTADNWHEEEVKPYKVNIHQTVNNVVMIPTMGNISDSNVELMIQTIKNIADANNLVLVVIKPFMSVVRRMCAELADYKDTVQFRFTITSLNPTLSQLWEPGAALPAERIECLQYAFDHGYYTSVSMEPMIDERIETLRLISTIEPYVIGDIWLGKMVDIDKRVAITDDMIRDAVAIIKEQQSDLEIQKLVFSLIGKKNIRYKKSIRDVVRTDL